MNLNDLFETHHAYDGQLSYRTPFNPIREGDTFRVFHGFRDLKDALSVCKNGTSGKLRANRNYSFEYVANPTGLYVTLDLNVATEFGNTVIEFTADLDELEAPVWPNGGYTVQGQMAGSFGHGAELRRNRSLRRKDAEKETLADMKRDPEGLKHVGDSDEGKRYLSHIFTASREYQALFIGHLNPSRIVSVYSRDSNNRYVKMDKEDFLLKNADKPTGREYKMFLPQDDFDSKKFLERMAEEYGKDVTDSLKTMWERIKKAPKDSTAEFKLHFEDYLWPKQYVPCIRWMKNTFK